MLITIGYDPSLYTWYNNDAYGYTTINSHANSLATGTGILDTFKFLFQASAGEDVKVGTFYGPQNACTPRDYELIGHVNNGSVQTFTGLDCDVETDDMIGIFYTSGSLRYNGGYTIWYSAGDHFSSGGSYVSYSAYEAMYGEGDDGATTAPPTTIAPTTLAPTTLAPTTLAPTTLAPTTLAPTTLAPTTLAPTTLAPTTIPPCSEHNYILGTARTLPERPIVRVLAPGGDYDPLDPQAIAKWISDRVTPATMDVSGRGEILCVAQGVDHTEVINGLSLDLNPISDDATHYAVILCESPSVKYTFRMQSNSLNAAAKSAISLHKYSRIYDGRLYSQTPTGTLTNWALFLEGAGTAAIGIIVYDVSSNFMTFGFEINPLGGTIVDSAVVGNITGVLTAGFGVNGANCRLINTTMTAPLVQFPYYNGDPGIATDINCCAQNGILPSFTGNWTNQNRADNVPLDIAPDGYTLLTPDGLGLDLGVFFSDDDNGEAFVPGAWDRGCDRANGYLTTLSPTTLGPKTLPPTTLPPQVIMRRGISNFGFSMRDKWRI